MAQLTSHVAERRQKQEVWDAIDLVSAADVAWRADHANKRKYNVLVACRTIFRERLEMAVESGAMSRTVAESTWEACK